MSSRVPPSPYWKSLLRCIKEYGLKGPLSVPGDAVCYFGSYEPQTAIIRFAVELAEPARSMVVTKELVQGVLRPKSDDPYPGDERIAYEEHVAHYAAWLICNHFGLGDHYKVVRSLKTPSPRFSTDEPTADEKARAAEIAEELRPKLERHLRS
jgi:hypothetical protein